MYKTIKTVLSVVLCVLLITLTACTDSEKNALSTINVQDAQTQSVIKLPQAPRFDKLLDGNGKIDLEFLQPVEVSKIKKNYDKRVYIEYNDKPYFYNPVYISYEQILNSRVIAQDRKIAILEDSFKKAKESGFKTVALFVDWKNFYNGTAYDFNFYKIYYTLAEKYDLNISIVWNSYAKIGFMPWQSDRAKYPALAVNGVPVKANVPDLSQEIYINEAVEAITQFCAWLNYIDYNRRTILIQFEDEANTNYGKGAWLSQYVNYSNLLLKMAEAVKNSAYSVVTTIGLTFDDYKNKIDGVTGRDRLDKFLNCEHIDGLGAANLISENFSTGTFANDNKFFYVSKLSPAIYGFFASSMALLSQGIQFGVYELKSFDLAVNCGMYRTHSTRWEARDRQTVDRGILAKKRTMEAATNDVVDFIKAINNIGDVLATVSILDIVMINPLVSNNYALSSNVGDIRLSFNNLANPYFTYNSAAVCAIDSYSNYYITTFHATSFLGLNYDGKIKMTEGKIVDGVWVADTEEKMLEDHYIMMKSGVVYKFVLE